MAGSGPAWHEPETPKERRRYEEDCRREISAAVVGLVDEGWFEEGSVELNGAFPEATIDVVLRYRGAGSRWRHSYKVWGPVFRDPGSGEMESPEQMGLFIGTWLMEPLSPGDPAKGEVTELPPG